MEERIIPTFYCCYLLRSTVSGRSLYIGSTPNPRRRLAQHNGTAKGGAWKTARAKLRPWEMICIVHGFPSSVGALQFEWSWQHPQLSKKIPEPDRKGLMTKSKSIATNLIARLKYLDHLVRAPAFARWPLTIRFFNEEVYASWQKQRKNHESPLPPAVDVILDVHAPVPEPEPLSNDEPPPSSQIPPERKRRRSKYASAGFGGVEGLDITGSQLTAHAEKAGSVLESLSTCGICYQMMQARDAVVCPHPFCQQASHVECIADSFLTKETGEAGNMLPIGGDCPGCGRHSSWDALIREFSLRTRAKTKASSKKATGKGSKKKQKRAIEEEDDDDDDDDDDDGDEPNVSIIDLADVPDGQQAEAARLLSLEDSDG